MADGLFYRDTRMPISVVDESSIATTTTAKAAWPIARTILPANYWTVGKTVKLTAMLKQTTGTAGNLSWQMALGTGDNPAVIVSTTARAKVASAGPFTTFIEGYATCRSLGTGTAATISMWGLVTSDLGLMLSTSQPNIFPAAGGTVVSTFDPTLATLALTFQVTESGGAGTMVCVGLLMEALN
jgi:hypothetical protein